MPSLDAIQAMTLFALWTLTIVQFGVGLHRWRMILTGRARINVWPADPDHGPPCYRRLMRAHANCLETLPVFAAVVLAVEIQGLSTRLFDQAATVVLLARIGSFLIRPCALILIGIIALGWVWADRMAAIV